MLKANLHLFVVLLILIKDGTGVIGRVIGKLAKGVVGVICT